MDDALPVGIMTYDEIMNVDLCMLRMCDAIYMLDGWTNSKGAWIEITDAIKNGLWIYQQSTNRLVLNLNEHPTDNPMIL